MFWFTKPQRTVASNSCDNLVSGTYSDKSGVETIYKAPDAIGNLFKTPQRKDRQYDKGGKLLKDEKYYYHYNAEGNLVFKEFITSGQPNLFDKKDLQKKLDIKLKGSGVGWIYEWAGNGMLAKVTLPQGKEVKFNYDPLGRRIAKQYKGNVTRWLWDGNVPLHEWNYEGGYPPGLSIDAMGSLKEEQEPVENLITWIYEQGSFTPCGKITGEEEYSIVSDYLGTPTHAFNGKGDKIWERELDIYGNVRKETGQKGLVPQLYQGQWVDHETGLAYNRFRYYDNESGNYISQDPIGLAGGKSSVYNYVANVNFYVDQAGLDEIVGALFEIDGKVFQGTNPTNRVPRGTLDDGIPELKDLGWRNATEFNMHAEIDAMSQAKKAGHLGGKATLMVDGLPVCGSCRPAVLEYAKSMGITELEVHELSTGKVYRFVGDDIQMVKNGGKPWKKAEVHH